LGGKKLSKIIIQNYYLKLFSKIPSQNNLSKLFPKLFFILSQHYSSKLLFKIIPQIYFPKTVPENYSSKVLSKGPV
jgi:hypothetical protein